MTSNYLRLQNRVYHYRRRVPKQVSHLDKRGMVVITLKTRSLLEAKERAYIVNRQVEEYWNALEDGHSEQMLDDAKKRYERAVRIAQRHGFPYLPADQVLALPPDQFADRVHALDGMGLNTAEALLGTVEKPVTTLDDAFVEFEKLTKSERTGHGKDQLRRWRNPRLKAIKYFHEVVGAPKDLSEITRNDALLFREWWQDRIEEEGMTGEGANKDFRHLSKIFRDVNDALRLNLTNPFASLSLKLVNVKKRPPFSNDELRAIINSDRLMQMNPEARFVLLVKIETGARTREICGLDPDADEIRLDADIPHIVIQPNQFRTLKVTHTERNIPLVGVALQAFQQMPRGTDQYRTGADSWSAAVNKFLRENDFFPTERHTANSIRHSFEDRLTKVEPPEKVQAYLMGHKYFRPRYGAGPDLEQTLTWLKRIELEDVKPAPLSYKIDASS